MIFLSPTISFVSAIFYSIFISFSNVELLYVLPILYVLFCEYKNIFQVFKRLIFLNLFILMIFIVLLLQTTFEEALNIYLRTNMIILFNLTVFYRSSGYDIVRALNDLKFPNKVVSSIYFTLKMIQILSDELKSIRMTLRARGFRANSSLFTYEIYGNLFGHIFVKSIKKAQALEESFKLRGFHGRIYLINQIKISYFDLILLFLISMLYVKGFVV
ncbi:energy-coupling factor transporter transmembrane component T family protein [Halarcobacter bivalviorum]|uniref:energy-coupling factor transporter transmembrane component T family protein n=1 Tax=Halarcobacter bivalviorum TaxID=663364 RepID=UPI00100BBC42|nr:energy-coupling factor transporter transmembrane component T [Halarcobacter bivalviorum]RXK05363.1 cobalt ABC transporter permease [Halarcobacter bivalviorum]